MSGWWLFVDMNAFFAACEQQDRPELRGRPIGVVPVAADTTCFIAVSYEAKMSGLKTGTRVGDARAICPNITLVESRPRLYREVHKQIVAAVESVAPIHEILSIDEMAVRPWRNEASLAEALRLGQTVQDTIRHRVGEWMSCSVGLAPNAFLAKVASDFQKPRGLSVIAPEDIPHKLNRLELSDWPGIARAMQRRFRLAGVTTTAQMYGMSVAEMRQVFGGINGERWWRMIRGEAVALPPVRKRQIGHSSVLAPEFRTPDGARCVASRLLEKAAERLRDEGYHARRLTVTVSSYSGENWTRHIRFLPCNQTLKLLAAMRGLWNDSVREPSKVELALQEILPNQDVIANLFDEGELTRIDAAVDELNKRYGRGTVTVASTLTSKRYLDHARIPFGPPR